MNLRAATVITLTLAAACGGDGRTVLTVYSPHGKELLEYYEAGFEKAQPDVDVQWVDMGSQEVLDRLRSEAANPQADVWFGAPAEIFDRAAREGLLAPYTPTWADAVPPEARDAQRPLVRHVSHARGHRVQQRRGERGRARRRTGTTCSIRSGRGRCSSAIPIAEREHARDLRRAIIARSIAQTGKPDAGLRVAAQARREHEGVRRSIRRCSTRSSGAQEGVITLYNMPDIATLEQRIEDPGRVRDPGERHAAARGRDRDRAAGRSTPTEAKQLLRVRDDAGGARSRRREKFLRIPARTDIPRRLAAATWIARRAAKIKPMPLDRAMLAATASTSG